MFRSIKIFIVCAILVFISCDAWAFKLFTANSLIGGVSGSVDNKDGALLSDEDILIAVTSSGVYFYRLDADSGAAENSPGIIAPDLNAGTKRWIKKDPDELDSVVAAISGIVKSNGSTISAAVSGIDYETPGSSATHAALTDAHGATGAVVGTTNPQSLTYKTLDDITNSIAANKIHIKVANATGGTLNSCTAVYMGTYNSGLDAFNVIKANAGAAVTMPAAGIVEDDINNGAIGEIYVSGLVSNLDTATDGNCGNASSENWAVGDELYINITDGMLTNIKPTGTALIQKIGFVARVHATLGRIYIVGPGRSNDIPNLASGYFWLGNASGVATPVQMSGDATMDNAGVITITGGSVNISGTPAPYQVVEWVNENTIKGTAVSVSSLVCSDSNGSITACPPLKDSVVFTAGGETVDSNNCAEPLKEQINSGPYYYTITCADNDLSLFSSPARLPGWDGGAIDLSIGFTQLANEQLDLKFDVYCQARGDGETINNTWSGTPVTVIKTTTGNNAVNFAIANGLECNCINTCEPGDLLTWKVEIDQLGTLTTMSTLRFIDTLMDFGRSITLR